MEAKHTPGPWHVYKGRGLYVDSSTAGLVCKVAENRSAEKEANAHLIAAAPELLAALEHMVAVSNWATTIQSEEQYDAMIASAEAAIRKAKGE